jgi:hypothetical protein
MVVINFFLISKKNSGTDCSIVIDWNSFNFFSIIKFYKLEKFITIKRL